MTYVEAIKNEQNYTLTENGAMALRSSSNALVNLFAVAGALRNRNTKDIELMFQKALTEDKLLATKLAFYTRDVRGGLGERKIGRIMFRYLAEYYPELLKHNLKSIPEFGRWDDVVNLIDLNKDSIDVIEKQLNADLENMMNNKPISLLAKWLPSVNASSIETNRCGKTIAKALGFSEKKYRQTLSKLRKYLNVVERNLSEKEYENIIYSEVPSKAMNIYSNAFRRNDNERFTEFLNDVKEGNEVIHSATLYPYDIVEKILYNSSNADFEVLEDQWKALPNYVEGKNNLLVMADVSGSMYGRPIATSIGLAMYFAERNKGAFANHFMTFSARPELVEIKGENLREKITNIVNVDWDMNTNLEAAFDLVLNTAIKNRIKQEEMPSSIVVITDMEIDRCSNPDWLFYNQMKTRFEENGYQIPNIVFWNVNSRNDTYHASFDRAGVELASGQSPSVFKSLVAGVSLTPYEYMLSVLNDKRYDGITI